MSSGKMLIAIRREIQIKVSREGQQYTAVITAQDTRETLATAGGDSYAEALGAAVLAADSYELARIRWPDK